MKFDWSSRACDAEQREQLVLPLAEQRLRDDEQDPLRALGPDLRDHQARLDRLSEPDFVGEDAAAFAETAEGEDDGIDLVRVRIDPRLPLRGGVAPRSSGRRRRTRSSARRRRLKLCIGAEP